MSPRANRRRRDDVPLAFGRLAGSTTTETYAGQRWAVRRLTGASSDRTYLCPGCQHGIPPGTPWDQVPMNWTCPECGARKEDFEMVQI